MTQQQATFDFSDPNLFEKPFGLYKELREQAPVFWTDLLDADGWLLTRYDDCVRVLTDREFFGPGPRTRALFEATYPGVEEDPSAIDFSVEISLKAMFVADVPYHTALRGAGNRGFFSPKVMAQYRQRTETMIEDLLQDLKGRRHMDLVADYAAVVPFIMFDFLDFPREDRDRVYHWTEEAVLFFGGFIEDKDTLVRVDASMRAFVAYILEQVQQRHENPGTDALSLMLTGAAKHGLPDRDIALIVLTIFGAGHATLMDNISMGVHTLLEHPDQLALLRERPELWPNAVEELLRFNTPQQILNRRVVKDVTLSDRRIHTGAMVFTVLGAANRDPEIFPDPDRFDITRENASKHLASGSGPHYCLGATLSRIESAIALEKLFAGFPGLHMTRKPQWRRNSFFRGIETMPVSW